MIVNEINPLIILLNNEFKLDKKFYFIGGNEVTLMEKKTQYLKIDQQNEKYEIVNIETIKDFVDEEGLFGNKKIFIEGCKGINDENLNKARKSNGIFIFIKENSQSTKKIKVYLLRTMTHTLLIVTN